MYRRSIHISFSLFSDCTVYPKIFEGEDFLIAWP